MIKAQRQLQNAEPRHGRVFFGVSRLSCQAIGERGITLPLVIRKCARLIVFPHLAEGSVSEGFDLSVLQNAFSLTIHLANEHCETSLNICGCYAF